MGSRISRRDESLAFQSAVLTVARAAGFAITFAIPIVLVRALGQDLFGLYKAAFLISATGARLLNLGLTASLFYFVPRDSGEGHRHVVQTLVVLSVVGILAAAGITLFREPIAATLNSPDLVGILPIVALMVLLMLPGDTIVALPVIDRRPMLGAGILAGSHLIRAALLIAAAVIYGTVEAVVWAGVIAAASTVLVLLVYTLIRGRGEPIGAPKGLLKEQFQYALPFAVAVFFEAALTSFHQFYVKGHVTDAVFAIYMAGTFQVPVIDMLVQSVAEVVLVRAAAAHERNDLAELRRVWSGGISRLAIVIIPVWFVGELLAPDIIGLIFGPAFLDATPIFRLFLVALLLYLIIDHAILRATGDTRYLLKANAVGFVMSAITVLVLAPINLMLGSVLGLVAGIAVMRFVGLYKVAQRLEIPVRKAFPWKSFGSALAASVASAGVAMLAYETVAESLVGLAVGPLAINIHFARLVVGGPVFLGVYGALAWTFELIPRSELAHLLRRVLPTKKVS